MPKLNLTTAQAGALLSVSSEGKYNSLGSIGNLPISEQNTLLEQLTNQLSLQIITNSVGSMNRYWEKFMKDTIALGAQNQIVENLNALVEDYDEQKFIESSNEAVQQLVMYLKTTEQKYTKIIITENIFSKAFKEGSISAFNMLISQMIERLTLAYDFYLYKQVQADIIENVRLGFTSTPDSSITEFNEAQQSMIAFEALLENTCGYPTREYNLDGRARMYNVLPNDYNDYCLMANARTLGIIKNFASSKIFKSQTLDPLTLMSDNQYKLDLMPDGLAIVLHKDAYAIFMRLVKNAQQSWAKNLTNVMYHHFWIIRGLISWKTGFKWFFNTPTLEFNGYKPYALLGGFTGQINFAKDSVSAYGANCITNFDTGLSPYTLTDKDWIELRVMVDTTSGFDKTGEQYPTTRTLKSVIYNLTGNNQSAIPSDMQNTTEPIDFRIFENSTLVLDGTENIIDSTDSIEYAELSAGTYNMTIQLFGYINGIPFISSGASKKLVVS